MKRHLPEEYNRRPIVETVHSVIKSGSYARSRILGQLEKEIALKIIAYNIRRIIILNSSDFIFIIEVFYRAELTSSVERSHEKSSFVCTCMTMQV